MSRSMVGLVLGVTLFFASAWLPEKLEATDWGIRITVSDRFLVSRDFQHGRHEVIRSQSHGPRFVDPNIRCHHLGVREVVVVKPRAWVPAQWVWNGWQWVWAPGHYVW